MSGDAGEDAPRHCAWNAGLDQAEHLAKDASFGGRERLDVRQKYRGAVLEPKDRRAELPQGSDRLGIKGHHDTRIGVEQDASGLLGVSASVVIRRQPRKE